MVRNALIWAATVFLSISAGVAWAQDGQTCQLCDPVAAAADKPGKDRDIAIDTKPLTALRIQVESNLEFGVAALGPEGGGSIAIDPRAELRAVSGGLIDLGGVAFSGVARLSGQPFRRVSIILPKTETLSAPNGAKAEISGFVANVPLNTSLDANGDLLVRFAGRFSVTTGQVGDFRGRVTIMAEYQ